MRTVMNQQTIEQALGNGVRDARHGLCAFTIFER